MDWDLSFFTRYILDISVVTVKILTELLTFLDVHMQHNKNATEKILSYIHGLYCIVLLSKNCISCLKLSALCGVFRLVRWLINNTSRNWNYCSSSVSSFCLKIHAEKEWSDVVQVTNWFCVLKLLTRKRATAMQQSAAVEKMRRNWIILACFPWQVQKSVEY